MKQIYPHEHIFWNAFIKSTCKGQTYINLTNEVYVKIGKDWYHIEKPPRDIIFPVTLKESNIKRLLERIDEITS